MSMHHIEEEYDVAVVGAGHAGCEAALACARTGLRTILFTVSVESIAMMPCNPNIGGSSKGHLVREVDALGGEMGKNIDRTFIQSKMLNRSKGPAVHSLRAQADKAEYSKEMRRVLENQENLTIRQQEVTEILTIKDVIDNISEYSDIKQKCSYLETLFTIYGQKSVDIVDNITSRQESLVPKCGQIIAGVRTISGAVYFAKAVILCTGVYLKSRCIYGDVSNETGPNGLMTATHLSSSLEAHGIKLTRFKTGTPARIDGRTVDFSKCVEQKGDERVIPFSFSTDPESVQIDQVSCWLTYTNSETHRIIRENIDRSPLYAGVIHATGPRYCPSIEDKVMKFADKERHQVFLEPEGLGTNEIYIDGMSSSMPEDVQFAMYRTVPGLENARIVRNAYAIEYDCLAPRQLKSSLEFKQIRGLFSGGQFNGSSGYEEAAAQGIMAGINASRTLRGMEPVVLLRSEAYIGVLVDDLVTKENFEPYRMMTSRAEYRLLLRQDNADLRLTRVGFESGLISEARMNEVENKRSRIAAEIERIARCSVGTGEEIQRALTDLGTVPPESGAMLADLIRRPELDYQSLKAVDPGRPDLPEDVQEQVNIEIKYEGYIKRQMRQVEQFAKTEQKKIPEDLDYDEVPSLRIEARQKLKDFRPETIGQASRIAGVSPADVSVLLVFLKKRGRA